LITRWHRQMQNTVLPSYPSIVIYALAMLVTYLSANVGGVISWPGANV
jgi:hypothetical protein